MSHNYCRHNKIFITIKSAFFQTFYVAPIINLTDTKKFNNKKESRYVEL